MYVSLAYSYESLGKVGSLTLKPLQLSFARQLLRHERLANPDEEVHHSSYHTGSGVHHRTGGERTR